MLPVTWATVRVFLHLLAATIWVGGQLTLAGLLPALRATGGDTPRIVARQFNRIAWPAFGVLVATGIWNVVALSPPLDSPYMRTLMVKIAIVTLSGMSALAHSVTRSRPALAVFGALGGVTALTALFFGTQLG